MPRTSVFLMLAGACALSACVTIHIYFPAAAAEKAADRIIDDIWQLPSAGQKTPQDKTPQDKEGKSEP